MKRLIFLLMIMAVLCCALTAGGEDVAEGAAAVTGTVVSVDGRFGDVTLSVTPGDLQATGIHANDIRSGRRPGHPDWGETLQISPGKIQQVVSH